jgi:K+ potassium transporter
LRQAPLSAALLTLGIVYGDLGTSPLYTLQTIVHTMGDQFTPEAALGPLSLISWFADHCDIGQILRARHAADNYGEGGILALRTMTRALWSGRRQWLVILGLFGGARICGDGIITPAISISSAVEGLNVVTGIFALFNAPMRARSAASRVGFARARGRMAEFAAARPGGPAREGRAHRLLDRYLHQLVADGAIPELEEFAVNARRTPRRLSMLIRRINPRSSVSIGGRPPNGRDFQRQ